MQHGAWLVVASQWVLKLLCLNLYNQHRVCYQSRKSPSRQGRANTLSLGLHRRRERPETEEKVSAKSELVHCLFIVVLELLTIIVLVFRSSSCLCLPRLPKLFPFLCDTKTKTVVACSAEVRYNV